MSIAALKAKTRQKINLSSTNDFSLSGKKSVQSSSSNTATNLRQSNTIYKEKPSNESSEYTSNIKNNHILCTDTCVVEIPDEIAPLVTQFIFNEEQQNIEYDPNYQTGFLSIYIDTPNSKLWKMSIGGTTIMKIQEERSSLIITSDFNIVNEDTNQKYTISTYVNIPPGSYSITIPSESFQDLSNNSMVPESPSVINGRREAQVNVGEVTVNIT